MEGKLGEIIINLDTLISKDLSANEYLFLWYLYQGNIQNAYIISKLKKEEVLLLEELGFIAVLEAHRTHNYQGKDLVLDEPNVVLNQAGIALFEESDLDIKFEEFWNTFPDKIPDGQGGTRVLHAKGTDTHDAEVCKKKYLKIIKDKPGLHNRIIKAIKANLYLERHKIQYLNNPETYINNKRWERYLDVQISETQEKVKRI